MNHPGGDMSAALAGVVRFYETLDAEAVHRVPAVYAADASFKDPFNEVAGHAAIVRIFRHMFVQVHEPRFVVTSSVLQGSQAFLCWEFHFRMKRLVDGPQCIRGATHLHFGPNGLVTRHRDYWDAAEELYEKLPLLGGLMRWLKKASNK